MYSFEKLEVWKISIRFVKKIYTLTSQFPTEEKFGITAQMRRSSISISSNIAEGSSRWSNREQARFYEIAYGSAIETLNHLIIANEMDFINKHEYVQCRNKIDSILIMVNRLYLSRKP